MEEIKLEIKWIPIGELVENTGQIPDVPKNPRKISKEKFKALCDSIKMSPEMNALDEVKVFPYDESTLFKDDYDMAIQQLNVERVILRVNSHHYICEQSTNVGGLATFRNRQREYEETMALRRKWGGQIIKLDETNKGHTNKQKIFDYNPIVRIPIKGV